MADLVAALRSAIEAARAARAMTRTDYVLTGDRIHVFPTVDPADTRRNLFSLSPSSGPRRLDVRRQAPVPRPQDCDCGASQVAMVAHWDRCASRAVRAAEGRR